MSNASHILRPRITEKASFLSERDNVYTFEVAPQATKNTIAAAVQELYKVAPVKVSIINLPAKRYNARGRIAKTAVVRKAMVYLKKGDKIEFV